MSRFLYPLLVFLHGAGHALFLANAWGYWNEGSGRAGPFVNTLRVSQTVEGLIGVVWLVPFAGFLAVAWGLLTGAGWWQPVALGSAALSLVLIVVWWGGLNTSSAFFALVFDLAVIAVVLWRRWTG